MKKFKPPPVTSPPTLVHIEWIDSVQGDVDEKVAEESGGLILLPSVGFHVRNGNGPKCGPFIVVAREYSDSQGTILVRDTHSIPLGWIRKWSVSTGLQQLYPKETL